MLFLKLWTSFVTLWTNKKEKFQFNEQEMMIA